MEEPNVNSIPHDTTQPSRMALAEASAWLAQLHGPDRNSAMEADFRGWLAADAEHARAFESVTDTWDAIGRVNPGRLPRIATRHLPRQSNRRWQMAAAGVACCMIAAAAWWHGRYPMYATGIGEQRLVTLEDGTRVSLNAATRIDLDFSATGRHVVLETGEALFEVARNSQRPFVVNAGKRVVTALGTSFVVRREADNLDVTLLDGSVSVGAGNGSPGAAIQTSATLSPGQRLVVRDGGQQIDTPPKEAATAWLHGEVILDNTPLAEAVTEMNRHDRQQLNLDGSSIGALPVSGIYRAGNNRDFANAVATVYGLDVVVHGNAIRLNKKKQRS